MTDDVTRELTGGLPAYFPNSPEDGNYKLLEAVGDALAKQDTQIEEVDTESTVQDAESIESLIELGKLVDRPPKEGSSLEQYRARLLSEYSTATGKGRIRDVIQAASRMLDIDKTAISYTGPPDSGSGVINLGLPGSAIDDSILTEPDIVSELDRTIAGSYRLEATRTGTFTYITPADYNSDLSDASKGYDGLDANDEPKDNGGTYAGLLN